jgi:hypothetical protein
MPTYNLATMFERVVELLTRAAAVKHGLSVKAQYSRSDALLDAEGSVYRRVRPDLVVFRSGRPLAVLDAKFKPRYLTGAARPPMSARVVLADAYQLFFYAERLRRLHRVDAPLPAFIVAPSLSPDDVPPPSRRTIRWGEVGGSEEVGLRVLALPLVEVVDMILSGSTTAAATAAASELVAAVEEMTLHADLAGTAA